MSTNSTSSSSNQIASLTASMLANAPTLTKRTYFHLLSTPSKNSMELAPDAEGWLILPDGNNYFRRIWGNTMQFFTGHLVPEWEIVSDTECNTSIHEFRCISDRGHTYNKPPNRRVWTLIGNGKSDLPDVKYIAFTFPIPVITRTWNHEPKDPYALVQVPAASILAGNPQGIVTNGTGVVFTGSTARSYTSQGVLKTSLESMWGWNPPPVQCTHEWIDTQLLISFCKHCDIKGRWDREKNEYIVCKED